MNSKISLLPICRYIIPNDMEKWLEKEAAEGWQVEKLGFFNLFFIKFHNTSPKKYKYVVDINRVPDKELYRHLGWKLVGEISNYSIWRQGYRVQKPEVFLDEYNLFKRNQKVYNFAFIFFVITLVALIVLIIAFILETTYGSIEGMMERSVEILFCLTALYYFHTIKKKLIIYSKK